MNTEVDMRSLPKKNKQKPSSKTKCLLFNGFYDYLHLKRPNSVLVVVVFVRIEQYY